MPRPCPEEFRDDVVNVARNREPGDGGLGLGTTVTSLLFLATILARVSYLAMSKRGRLPAVDAGRDVVTAGQHR